MAVDEAGLIAGFYDAAFDAALFPDRLRQLAAFAGGVGAVLWLSDHRVGSPALAATSGHLGADAVEAYSQYYGAVDPYRPRVEARPSGVWTLSTELFDDRFVAKDPYSNEYLIPRGVRSFAATRLVAGEPFDAFLSIHREPGAEPFSTRELQSFKRFGPHLARAVRVYVHLARTRPAHDAALALLEHAAPAVLVDATCRVLFANPAAEALLRADEAIRMRHGRLSVGRSFEDNRLQQLVAVATGTRDPAGSEMLIGRPPGRPPLALMVTPIRPTATPYSLAPVPAALVLFHDPARNATDSAKRLQSLFNLTPAEAMLAQGLIEGKRLVEIAADRQVSVETVRTQLRSVFRKTGVSRQTDLVRMLQAMFEWRP